MKYEYTFAWRDQRGVYRHKKHFKTFASARKAVNGLYRSGNAPLAWQIEHNGKIEEASGRVY